MPFEHAALIEAVSIAVHAANRTPVKLGDTAVVMGSGMIGSAGHSSDSPGWARPRSSLSIWMTINSKSLSRLGADVGINAKNVNAAQEVAALTGGRGADVGIEVVGATATIQSTIDCVKRGGAITLVGNLAPKIELPLQAVVTRELSIYGSCASNGEYPECIEYLRRGAIKVQPLITATAKLEEGPQWFEKLYAGLPGAMKVILQPNG